MRIALVDDRPDALVKLSDTLNDYAARNGLHFDLCFFPSGESLLESYSAGRYSVIFLDVFMDGITGIETAERIRETDEDVWDLLYDYCPVQTACQIYKCYTGECRKGEGTFWPPVCLEDPDKAERMLEYFRERENKRF